MENGNLLFENFILMLEFAYIYFNSSFFRNLVGKLFRQFLGVEDQKSLKKIAEYS